MYGHFAFMYVHVPSMCNACKDRRGCWTPEIGVTDGCEPYWESNLVPLKEQPVHLIAKFSFQPRNWFFKMCYLHTVKSFSTTKNVHRTVLANGITHIKQVKVSLSFRLYTCHYAISVLLLPENIINSKRWVTNLTMAFSIQLVQPHLGKAID